MSRDPETEPSTPSEPIRAGAPNEAVSGPLRGIRALDFGVAAAGPVSLMYLAMLGAEVIKIESPRGDHVRWTQPRIRGMGATFLGNNLGKRGLILDLKKSRDLRTAHALIKTADVALDNFRDATVMERLGLGYETLRSINARLIYVQSSGFGRSKKYKGMFCNEWIAQAISGFAASTGAAESTPQLSRGTAYLDWFAALINVQAILVGLSRRSQTGQGIMIETSQYAAALCAGATRSIDELSGRRRSEPLEFLVLTRDDRILAISVPSRAVRLRLYHALGVEPTRLDSTSDRTDDADEIQRALTAFVGKLHAEDCARRLTRARIPFARVSTSGTISDILLANPQVEAQDLVVTLPSKRGTIRVTAPPWQFSRTRATIASASPELGEHQRAIMHELRGT